MTVPFDNSDGTAPYVKAIKPKPSLPYVTVNSNPTSLMTGVLDSTQGEFGAVRDISIVTSQTGGDGGDTAAADNGDGNDNDGNDDIAVVNGSDDVKDSNDDDPKPKIDFLQDDIKDMTYGRRIALSLMNKRWYNPMAGEIDDASNKKESDSDNCDEKCGDAIRGEETGTVRDLMDDFDANAPWEKPCLKKGWAFFEHQALCRFLVPKGHENKPKKNIFTRAFRKLFMQRNKKYDRAEAGEDENRTRFYHPLWTPHKQLGDFGLGIGLYFSTLRALILITLIGGFLSLYNIMFFASEEYDYDKANMSDISPFLVGSAICMSNHWVPCPTCDCLDKQENLVQWGRLPSNRCAVSNTTDGTELLFALKNDCDGTMWQLAATNFATVVFVVLAVMLLGMYMRREEVRFDEDEQTAQDYSILITNPPPDAKDPEEWRRFFEEKCDGAQVTVCTCAVENDMLVRTLVERRERIRCIQSIRPGESLDLLDIARVSAEIERDRSLSACILAMVVPGIPEHFSRVVALKAKVEGLAQLSFPVTNVFLTFETEEDQRHVLEKLSVGSMKSSSNDKSALSDPKYLFRGERVLSVCEPEEPNTIRWQDLNVGFVQRLKETILTTILTLVSIVVVALIIYYINNENVVWSAYAITFFGIVFPVFAKLMTNHLESHRSESSKQTSLYYKIVLFRWVTTAVLFFVITNFTDTLQMGKEGILQTILALFISDMTLTNALQLADPLGHLQRHFLAPRAKTQDAMDILFDGTQYELAERYSDMTKILLLCLFYCSIFPASFFLCAISLTLKYYVDRFNLMRTWKRAPHLGPVISKASRRYFLSIAVGIMAVLCSYYWTGFPFDNICQDSTISASYVGNFTLSKYPSYEGEFLSENITLTDADYDFSFCNMDFMGRYPYISFPFVPSMQNDHLDPHEYMTEDQLLSTTYFGWSAFVILIGIFLKYVVLWYGAFRQLYHSSYEAVGDSQGIPYSEVTSRCAYIPQVTSCTFAYPLIACKIDGIDQELFDFKDPHRSHKYYDLSVDAKKLLKGLNIDDPPGFSIVKHWAPKTGD